MKSNNDNSQELLRQLMQLAWQLRRYAMYHHSDRGPMGSPFQGQGRILALLRLTPEISQKELSTILDIRPQSLGELLAKLERSGYITRTPSEADRRSMDIRLTEAGRDAAEQTEESGEPPSIFDCLSEEERASLADYVDRLLKSLESELDAADAPDRPFHQRHASPMDRRGPLDRGPFLRRGFDPRR